MCFFWDYYSSALTRVHDAFVRCGGVVYFDIIAYAHKFLRVTLVTVQILYFLLQCDIPYFFSLNHQAVPLSLYHKVFFLFVIATSLLNSG